MRLMGQRLNKIVIAMLVSGAMAGCSLRDDEANPPPADPVLLQGTVTMGPISGGSVSLFTLSGRRIGKSVDTTEYDPTVDTMTYGATGKRLASAQTEGRKVGGFTISITSGGVKDSDLVLLQVDGGVDIDPNDDGVIATNEGLIGNTQLAGSLYAVVYYGDLRDGNVVVNPFTTMAYPGVMHMSDPVEIAAALDSFARFLFKDGALGDINGDGVVDLRDLYAFDPSMHTLTANGLVRPHDAFLRRVANFTSLLPDSDSNTTTFNEGIHGGFRAADVYAWIANRFGKDANGVVYPFVDLATHDIDNDGLVGDADPDSDNDGVPDSYEFAMGLNAWVSDAAVDDDGDGLSNVAEYNLGTNPFSVDTDNDGISDKEEQENGLDPLSANSGDSDNDGLSDYVEVVERHTDPLDINDPSTDIDGDGLSNDQELLLGTNHLDINDPSTDPDGDGLDNDTEIANGLDPLVANTGDLDGDGLKDKNEVLGTAIIIGGVSRTVTSNPLLMDTDGDGLSDGLEVKGYLLFDNTTLVMSDPSKADSDGDKIDDNAEKGVHDAFRDYVAPGAMASFLMKLRPDQATTLNVDGLHITSAGSANGAGMEDDPDGDGKPTIEELYHGSLPNTASSTFKYLNERDPVVWKAMTDAYFRYVPGGFDVDGDGVVESGFWLAQFEARRNASRVTYLPSSPAEVISGSLDYLSQGRIVEAAELYRGDPDGNSVIDGNGDFGGLLCSNLTGTAVRNGVATTSCSANRVITAWPTQMQKPYSVNFAPGGIPYRSEVDSVTLSWLEARTAVLDSASAVPNGKPIDLVSEKQWAQVMALVVNNPENWTSALMHGGSGAVGAGGHLLMRGNTDGSAVLKLTLNSDNPANGYEGTAFTNNNDGYYDRGEEQRRTLIVQNGTMGRDFDLPASYKAVFWDLSGNLWELTRGLAFINDNMDTGTTANAIGYGNSTPDSAPEWWKPNLGSNAVLDSAGYYLDAGLTVIDRLQVVNLQVFSDQISAVMRGGCFDCSSQSGIATVTMEYGPGGASASTTNIGFRASAK